jgi:hypothetical protein
MRYDAVRADRSAPVSRQEITGWNKYGSETVSYEYRFVQEFAAVLVGHIEQSLDMAKVPLW